MVDTLADHTARLMQSRAKDAAHAPAARFGRAADNPTLEASVVRGATAMPRAFAQGAARPTVIDTGRTIPPLVEKIKDPEQMKLRPAGYEPAGHAPQMFNTPGMITSQTAAIRRKFEVGPLNRDHAQAAHDAEARVAPIISGSTVDRIRTVTHSDMRPIGRMAAGMEDNDGGR